MESVNCTFPGSHHRSATASYHPDDRDVLTFNRAAFLYGCNLNSLKEAFIQVANDKPDCYQLINDPEKCGGYWVFRKCHDFV